MLLPDHSTAVAALLVGLIWGSTNPFIRRGTLAVEAARTQQATDKGTAGWRSWVTPGILIPWLANQLGSVLFVLLLGQADISMAVPVANAISIAANAVVSVKACVMFEDPLASTCRYPLACIILRHLVSLPHGYYLQSNYMR
jgi:hypothetical protein